MIVRMPFMIFPPLFAKRTETFDSISYLIRWRSLLSGEGMKSYTPVGMADKWEESASSQLYSSTFCLA